jgi:hypothetical protein
MAFVSDALIIKAIESWYYLEKGQLTELSLAIMSGLLESTSPCAKCLGFLFPSLNNPGRSTSGGSVPVPYLY